MEEKVIICIPMSEFGNYIHSYNQYFISTKQ